MAFFYPSHVNAMQQIHNLVMCLNFNGIEIKTVHSLESWSGGMLVVVSGYVQLKDYSVRRNFVQTFFLAPQEKGYFVLNDILHFLEEDHVHQLPEKVFVLGNFENKLNASNSLPASCEQIQVKDFLPSAHAEEIETVDKYNTPELLQEDPVSDKRKDQTPSEEPTVIYPSIANNLRNPSPVPAEESVVELPKQTYASILRVKGQSGQPLPHPTSLNKSTLVDQDWHQNPLPTTQQSQSALGAEKSSSESVEETLSVEDESEEISVYVGNLPSSISASDLELEFKNFGKLKPDGVAIRSCKEAGVFYAFIEFEDATGVQNALKSSPIQLNRQLIHVEGRRPKNGASRGRRGRGRGGYQSVAPRGGFGGRTFGRGMEQDNSNGFCYIRPRGNGYLQRVPRQQRGASWAVKHQEMGTTHLKLHFSYE